MTIATQTARRLAEHRPGHQVISLYLDLDPERFATAPARASQVRSLLDEAGREAERDDNLSHEERAALREDLARVTAYLEDPPVKGARALAIFCSSRDGLFETIPLTRPAEARVVIDQRPYVEPLLAGVAQRRWLVVLVSRQAARFLSGSGDRLSEQTNSERSTEQDADDHLREVAETIARSARRERFDRLALGGTAESVSQLTTMLSGEARRLLVPTRVEVDVEHSTDAEVVAAVAPILDEDEQRREREALDRMAAGIGSGSQGTGGPEETLKALNERRVESLLLAKAGESEAVTAEFDRPGGRCPACGMLTLSEEGTCPADGASQERVEHLREAVVEAALAQDAEIVLVSRNPDLGPFQGIGAVLRF
jgi:hypothetical protein